MVERDLAFEKWRDRAADADILEVALAKPVSAKIKRHGREWIGPCPACDGVDRFAINPKKGVFNCRGAIGGGVITMVMHTCKVGFLAACEIITGEPPPTGGSQISEPELEAQERVRQAERERKAEERDRENDIYREREREKVFDIWRRATPIAGSSVERYLTLRGVAVPPGMRVRVIEDMPYYDSGKKDAEVIHRGPAMLVPIIRGGKFSGLHITYIDLAQPKGKLALKDGVP